MAVKKSVGPATVILATLPEQLLSELKEAKRKPLKVVAFLFP
jgi:hypothetical protein